MQWRSEGIVISAKSHGENHLVLGAFTRDYGYHKGYVFGGNGSRKRPLLELGNLLDLKWSSRFEDQLGTFTIEPVENYASSFFHDATRLCALNSMAHFLHFLPERQPHEMLYGETLNMLAVLREGKKWYLRFVLWELSFLEALGFALDLSRCALTRENSGLCYVSPNTGRAVTKAAGAPYADKLLSLPDFLQNPSVSVNVTNYNLTDIRRGLALTEFFLDKMLKEHFCTGMPEVRGRMVGLIVDDLDQ